MLLNVRKRVLGIAVASGLCWLLFCAMGRRSLPDRQRRVLFFVRVPKTGSEMTAMLMQWLQGVNNFRHVRLANSETHRLDSLGQLELRESVRELVSVSGADVSFDRHVFFTDLENVHERVTVAYFSCVRDPVDRIVSQFYYSRATPPPNLKLPPNVTARTPVKHRYQTFEQCFRASDDAECSFVSGRHYNLQIPYFCGHDDYCTELNNGRALEQAKNNVERHFAVVGVLERLNCTLKVMETKLNTFFRGVQDMYFNQLLEPKKNKNNKRPRQLSATIQRALRNNLTMEYAFYEFVRQRLDEQCRRS